MRFTINISPNVCVGKTLMSFYWQNLPTLSLSWPWKICMSRDAKENKPISQKDIEIAWANNFVH